MSITFILLLQLLEVYVVGIHSNQKDVGRRCQKMWRRSTRRTKIYALWTTGQRTESFCIVLVSTMYDPLLSNTNRSATEKSNRFAPIARLGAEDIEANW